MEEIHKKVLLMARTVLVDSLETDSGLWDFLLAKSVFTKMMLERITCQNTPTQTRQQLMDDLPRRGPMAFPKFLEILRDTGQPHLASYLEGLERHLRYGGAPPVTPSAQAAAPPTYAPVVPPATNRRRVINLPEQPNDSISVGEILASNDVRVPRTEGVIDIVELKPQAVAAEFLARHQEGAYRVLSNPKGLILIISNRKFVNKSERIGTDVDCTNLTNVFTNLGYSMYGNQVYKDQKAQQMKDLCRKFILDPDHRPLDSCVLCILSHGDSGGLIYGSDDETATVDELFGSFNNNKCHLRGKPKLVIIQACRGSMKDTGAFDRTDTSSEGDSSQTIAQNIIDSLQVENYKDTQDLDKRTRTPIYADIIFANSTTPGFVSWRHEIRGSWFIQTIAKVFAQYAHQEHVADMLTMVNRIVTEAFGGKLDVVMMPHPVNRLLKKFYFMPQQK